MNERQTVRYKKKKTTTEYCLLKFITSCNPCYLFFYEVKHMKDTNERRECTV